MAQVGRISGPLLDENLLRNGVDLAFRNDLSTQQLLYLDVSTQRIGVNTNTPSHDLQISGTTRTTDLIVDDTANIDGVWTIQTDTITLATGDIKLKASEAIRLSNLETDVFSISDNFIKTNDSNANIDLVTNGTGTVEIFGSGLEVKGNLYTPGNITFDGDIYFGNTGDDSTALADTVEFNSDIDSNIIPDIDATYDLGSTEKYWSEIETTTAHGQLSNMQQLSVSQINLNLTHGNVFYVAENGDDDHQGDHFQEPLATLQEAIARADSSAGGPVTIYVSSGTYEEQLPLEVPDRVSVIGSTIRNTIIKPATGSESKDVFHLGESAIVANITVSDFFYNNINDTGYAFRFKQDAVVAERSPYVQNVTVITKGSVTSADDPRGFAQGDAGKGALIDKDELNASTVEGSMLFHSSTFITPGVDSITITNGSRVEWLNSFTYFANRGLYLTNGSTGNGAELRSIGSANVYGNYGVVADGNNTLAYLIQHNMAYIGVGKFVDNDASRAIQSNETVELNSGVINYVTTDHTGSFRIGDNFLVDFETGATSLDTSAVTLDTLDTLRIQDGLGNETLIIPSAIDIGNLQLTGNTFSSVAGEINIDPTNEINFDSNVNLDGNLDITGDLSYDGVLNLAGDQPTDTVTFNVNIQQDFNPNTDSTFNLGSFSKEWTNIWLSEANIGDVNILDNVIDTTITNAYLELRANGIGEILISSNDVNVTNDFTVSGFTTLNETSVEGSLTLFGDLNQTGSFTVTQDILIDQNLIVDASAQFEEILIDDNFVTTTTSNADLELRANGTSIVNLQETVNVENNLSARDTTATNTTVDLNVTADNANVGNVEINDNNIQVTSLNDDLILNADRDIVVTGTDVTIGQDLTVNGTGGETNDGVVTSTFIGGEAAVQKDIFGEALLLTAEPSSATWIAIQTLDPGDAGIITDSGIDYPFTLTSWNSIDREEAVIDIPTLVNGFSSFNITVTIRPRFDGTALQNTSITGTLTQTGDRIQTGNYLLTNYNITGNLDVSSQAQFEEILFDGNVIQTTTSDSDLELRANGTGKILIDNTVHVIQNLTVDNIVNNNNINVTLQTEFNETDVSNITVKQNYITTNNGNLDLLLRASGTGEILIPNNNVIFEQDLIVEINTDLQDTNITGTLAQTGDRTQTGNIEQYGELTVDSVYIEDNFITSNESNADLELRANGTGKVLVTNNNFEISNNLEVTGTTSIRDLQLTGNINYSGDGSFIGLYTSTNLTISNKLTVDANAQFEEILVANNVITTTSSNSNLELRASGTGEVLISNNNVQVNNNLFTASITTGNINVDNDLVLDELVITDSNIEINENYITTKTSNADLELRATGDVVIQENTLLEQDLTVNGNTELLDTIVVGDVELTGNRIQTGDYTLIGNLNISSLITDQAFRFDDIKISGNVLETTLSNSDLELRAAGTSEVVLQENVQIGANLTVDTLNVDSISVDKSVDLEVVELSTDIQFEDNTITTTNSNSNLELRAVGSGSVYLEQIEFTGNTLSTENAVDSTLTNIELGANDNLEIDSNVAIIVPKGTIGERNNSSGDLRFNTEDNVFEGFSGSNITFSGVYSASRNASVTAHPFNNTLLFATEGTQHATIDIAGMNLHGLQVGDILFDENTISTNISNSDLELRTDGTGKLMLDYLEIKGNAITNNTPDENIVLQGSDNTHYVKFAGDLAVKFPSGTTLQRPLNPAIGTTRHNNQLNILETWTGTEWKTSAGDFAAISEEQMDEEAFVQTLIYG
mgnify:CR=1 FL=1